MGGGRKPGEREGGREGGVNDSTWKDTSLTNRQRPPSQAVWKRPKVTWGAGRALRALLALNLHSGPLITTLTKQTRAVGGLQPVLTEGAFPSSPRKPTPRTCPCEDSLLFWNKPQPCPSGTPTFLGTKRQSQAQAAEPSPTQPFLHLPRHLSNIARTRLSLGLDFVFENWAQGLTLLQTSVIQLLSFLHKTPPCANGPRSTLPSVQLKEGRQQRYRTFRGTPKSVLTPLCNSPLFV